ncbi:hypothetical protein [Azohydromonas caseinilytica]|uniref:DUF2892 domain-containing protein n=1 Tax=Azohydromonas caseinilytica TaxID=2728836 RepID=A0A848FJ87_9BURK|nr:hypothetical protein [Azohydromonas caseinilytica]NML18303.1 hypothetical protein [Azohydromonas caseinilytica]
MEFAPQTSAAYARGIGLEAPNEQGVHPAQTLPLDRTRRHTAREVLRRIDEDTVSSLARCAEAGPAAITARLGELDREWDTDRVLELEAASMGLLGVALAAWKPRLLALPGVVALALMVQATTGRYPLMPLFRRLGVRTAREIERERHALKALRGDFAGMDAHPSAAPGTQALPPRADLH